MFIWRLGQPSSVVCTFIGGLTSWLSQQSKMILNSAIRMVDTWSKMNLGKAFVWCSGCM